MENVFDSIVITLVDGPEDATFTALLKVEETLELPTKDVHNFPDLKDTAKLTVAELLVERIFQDAIEYSKAQGAPTPGRWLANQLITKTRKHLTPEELEDLRAPSLNDVEITTEKKEGRLYFTAKLSLEIGSWGPREKPDKEALTIYHEDMKARIREHALSMVHDWIQDASKEFSIFNVHTWIPHLRFYESPSQTPGNPILLMHAHDTTHLISKGKKEKTIIQEQETWSAKVRAMGLIDRIFKRWPQ